MSKFRKTGLSDDTPRFLPIENGEVKETRIIEKILPSGKTRIVTQVVVPAQSPDVDADEKQANLEISDIEETLHEKNRKHPNPYKTVKVDIDESSLSESTQSYNDAL